MGDENTKEAASTNIGFGWKPVSEQSEQDAFAVAMNKMKHQIHENAVKHGWWDKEREDGTCIALMHSELSECLEAMRNDFNAPDKHCPTFSAVTVELADCIIRILDYCGKKNLPIAEAIVAKHKHNINRPYKHGGKAF